MATAKRIWATTQAEIAEVLDGLCGENLKDSCWDLFQSNLFVGKISLTRQVLAGVAGDAARELAALVAVLNSELPQIGGFILRHLVLKFRSDLKPDPMGALHTALFVADLCNHGMAQLELVAKMILVLRHVDVAGTEKVVGRLFAKTDVKDYLAKKCPAVATDAFDLDLVMDKHKHLHGDIDIDTRVEQFPAHEHEWPDADKWADVQRVILGLEPPQPPAREPSPVPAAPSKPETNVIIDMTQTEDVNFKKQVYLVVMSALSAEEATHKVLRLRGRPAAIVNVLVEIAGQEKTANAVYANIGYRLCRTGNDEWRLAFETEFVAQLGQVEQYETNQIRNVGRLFGYLLASGSLDWRCMDGVDLTMDGSTPSTRIFLQSVFEEMRSEMGMAKLVKRLGEPELSSIGIFPADTDDKKFARDFFRAIKLGAVADLIRSRI